MRKETGNPDIFSPIELEKKGAKQLLTVTLMRPLHMIAFEAIVLFTCLYLSLAYVRTSILSTLLVWVESQKIVYALDLVFVAVRSVRETDWLRC